MPDPLPATASHPHARAVLGAALPPDGSPSHAYLFHGPAGAGKRETARSFAARLLSDGARDPVDAERRAVEGVHPDLTWVRPTGNELRVGDVDEAVIAAAAMTPFESRRRVFVIEDAETMNDPAANRMLKTLEEPAPFAHLILLTNRVGDVMPTILSRCQLVRFEAPAPEELEERLQSHGIPPASARACARLSLGDAQRALSLGLGDGPALRAAAEAYARATISGDLLSRPWTALLARSSALGDDAGSEVEEKLTAELDFLPRKEQARAKREAAEAAKRAVRRARTTALDQALQLAGLWFRDCAAVADGAEELVHHTDRLEALREDAEAASPHALRAAVGYVDESRAALKLVNATEELTLEALAYRLARSFS